MALRHKIREAVFSLLDAADAVTGKRGPMVPPRRLMNGGSNSIFRNDFTEIGDSLFHLLVEVGEVKPTDRVLDIGCSVGRMAIPLTTYLTSGTYDGFDNVKASIDYCQRAISPRHPPFQFVHADIRNSTYNRGGLVEPSEFVFPYADASFDFVFMTSIFTHMQRPETEQYLTEIARVLAPGGRLFATFFLLDEAADAAIREGRADFTFRHAGDGAMVQKAEDPDHAVAYPATVIASAMDARGLRVLSRHRGSWIGEASDKGYQDTIVAARSPA